MSAPAVLPAATIVLLRETAPDAPHGFEVFLVKRPATASFLADAFVFPGGRVDEDDRAREWIGQCDDVSTFVRRGREDAGTELAHGVAAIRELLEEAGVLLARGGDGVPVDDAGAIARVRGDVHGGAASFLDSCRSMGWRLALDAIHPWSRWVTPAFEPKRFDTRFYVARWDATRKALHDGRETVDSAWMLPSDALERAERGDRLFGLPTLRTLQELLAHETPADAIRAAAGRPLDPIHPVLREREGARWLLLPGDPDYPAPVSFAVGAPARYRLDGARWKPA